MKKMNFKEYNNPIILTAYRRRFLENDYLEREFWVDEKNNAWNTEDYPSEEDVIFHSKNLIDCENCVDCIECTSCIDCIGCGGSSNLVECIYLERSGNCVRTSCGEDVYGCYNCTFCLWIRDSVGCIESGGDSENCINCEDCTNCRDCMDCNGCVNCKDCNGCENCKDCNACENCKDCSGKTQLKNVGR